MTLTLTRETEEQLTAVAALRGLPPEDTVAVLVADEARRIGEEAERADAVAGLRRGTAEIAAGDWVALEDLRRDMSAQAQKRRSVQKAASEGGHA